MSQSIAQVLNLNTDNVVPFTPNAPIQSPAWINDRIHRFHPTYECLLYLWCAEGIRRKHGIEIPTWWVYVEYRKRNGASAYQAFEFDHPNQAQRFLQTECVERQYSKLSADKTRARPIGFTN